MEHTKADIQSFARTLGRMSATAGDSYDLAEPLAQGYAENVGDYGKGSPILDQIVALNSLRAACEELISWRVADARLQGLSWEKISDVLEMSRQGAWEKYRPRG